MDVIIGRKFVDKMQNYFTLHINRYKALSVSSSELPQVADFPHRTESIREAKILLNAINGVTSFDRRLPSHLDHREQLVFGDKAIVGGKKGISKVRFRKKG